MYADANKVQYLEIVLSDEGVPHVSRDKDILTKICLTSSKTS